MGVAPIVIPVRVSDDLLSIRASAIDFPFIVKDPLERLHNANTVTFVGQFTLTDGRRNLLGSSAARFALSYDVWAERFQVTLVKDPKPSPNAPYPSVKNLTKERAQAWCLDQLAVNISGISPDRQIWLRLEIRSEEPDRDKGIVGEPGISLGGLVAWFSRPTKSNEVHLVKVDGPFTLSDLRRGHL